MIETNEIKYNNILVAYWLHKYLKLFDNEWTI